MTTAVAKKSNDQDRFPLHGWERSQGVSYDDLIDAYLQGRKEEKSETEKILSRTFQNNIIKAQGIGADMFKEITATTGINPVGVFLKAEGLTSFDFLFLFGVEDYISDEMFRIYQKQRRVKSEVNDDSFSVSFLNMPVSGDLDENCLMADGYLLYYDEKTPKSRAS